MTGLELLSGQGKAKGNLDYSSRAVKRYYFSVSDASVPLKSILNLSIGFVALIKLDCLF